MIEVIPAILEKNINDIKAKVELVKPFCKRVHLDIMDGAFVPNVTYNDPRELAENKLGIKFWPHLMIKHPELFVKKWNIEEVEGIIFHKEAAQNVNETIRLIKGIGKKAGIAINPHTSSYDIKEYLDELDLILVMGVEPGFAHQAFNSDVLDKISYLKKIKPSLPIAVDGGVNMETRNKIKRAGADILSANSFIFNSGNIKEAIEALAL
ncbi:MAG: ribulose-phosphate 3-epimerase [Patescibacteria group bacterium]|jgi:ribulose-phosphate 3-epimerase